MGRAIDMPGKPGKATTSARARVATAHMRSRYVAPDDLFRKWRPKN